MKISDIKKILQTVFIFVIFSLLFSSLLTYVYLITKKPIEDSEKEAKLLLINQILPLNKDFTISELIIEPNELLGNKSKSNISIIKVNNIPKSIILEAITHDGYSGDIKLLIAINIDGNISGVRVISHKETPGLGDYIDISHSKWITLFNQKSLLNTTENKWKVKKDGGDFDYMSGATITPRAVVKCVANSLKFFESNKSLFLS